MKKLFVLLALACCLSIGCKPKETTDPAPAPTADSADDGAMDSADGADSADDGATDGADAGS